VANYQMIIYHWPSGFKALKKPSDLDGFLLAQD